MDWTKRQIINAAFEEIGYANYDYEIQAEQYQSALNRLDAMVSTWKQRGLTLDYALPAAYGGSDLDDDSDIDNHIEAVYLNLALKIAPIVGKVPSKETKSAAAVAFRELQSATTSQSEWSNPKNLPVGAGNKSFRSGLAHNEFFNGSTSSSSSNTGVDVSLAAPTRYLSISGQELTADLIDLTSHVTGVLPVANFATGTPTGSKFVRDDGTLQTIAGGGDALVANPLSQFAATTSLQFYGVISDGTGTGAAVFATSPTFVTPNLGTPASGNLANCTFPTLNQSTTGNAATVTTNANLTGDVTSTGNATTISAGAVDVAMISASGTPSSSTYYRGDNTWSTIAGGGDALVANPLSQFASTTSLQLLGVISDETGTGALVFATSPTLVTPALGTPSAIVLTNATGTASSLTAGTVTTNANLTGHVTSVGNAAVLGSFTAAQLNTAISDGTVALVADNLSVFAATTSAQLATLISDETGSGALVFATSPTLVTPALGTPASGDLQNCTVATETTAGIVERATQAEVNTGTDTTRYVSPDTLEGHLNGNATITDGQYNGSQASTLGTITGSDIECDTGVFFEDAFSTARTYTLSGIPASPNVYVMRLRLVPSSGGSVVWTNFTNLEWAGGSAPTLTAGTEYDCIMSTDDAGANWRGIANEGYS